MAIKMEAKRNRAQALAARNKLDKRSSPLGDFGSAASKIDPFVFPSMASGILAAVRDRRLFGGDVYGSKYNDDTLV